MRFTLFSEKTVPQCMNALNERLQAKPSKTRPALEGWIEKNGSFSLSVSSKVVGNFTRHTRLSAKAERDKGLTVIRGYVSDGISPSWLRILMIVVMGTCVVLYLIGEPMLAVITVLLAIMLYIPMRGDYINSDTLLIEVEKTLKASPKPPKNKT